MVARVCLVSGGTGGHLMPALVLGRALHARGHEPVLVTEGREVERELLRREPLVVRELHLPGGRPKALTLPFWLLRAVAAARRLLREQAVGCVVSTGGRPSVPMGLAARSLGLPVFLLEQNAVTGRANRWLAPLALRVYHGLPNAAGYGRRGVLTGTPLRAEFAAVDRRSAREALGLDERPVVLVTGGSQGAAVLNQMVPAALLGTGLALQVLHLAGLGNDEAVRRAYAAGGGELVRAFVRPVAADMDRLFGAADLVVCRGGGTTVAELAAVGRPAVIVPYPHHKDRQQWHNAQVLGRAGAALVIEERALTLASLTEQLGALLRAPERLAAMGQCAAGQHPGDPVAAILADLEQVLAAGAPS
ncbi:MAG: UDP-N-acetylglucosamine--N-acetylmuramyl-(pentapeptide) pyrophosphoryl-undecaprenol N-acetylglucosamine transferase [Planctomycetes bacterium]|nr:UDP-N-acetylglucosamine--N-acetylmuramyl-(pentapeptide) pyrophosphoryl-undecaprenol N-acetylglucosamine transferase [Planctomycetota bacterium]